MSMMVNDHESPTAFSKALLTVEISFLDILCNP